MPKVNHTHTYVQYKRRPGFFRCADPICNHQLDKEAVLGKLTRCTSCGAEFVLNREDLRRVKPKCLNCSKTSKARTFKATQNFLADVFKYNKEDNT